MYKDTVTWNPFVGCKHNCIYCDPSFKRQAKRQKQRCMKCYNFKPHFHKERLKQYLPKDKLIFVCSMGDISFANPWMKAEILTEISRRRENTFLIQTKNPSCLVDWRIPSNCIVGTTIETNRKTNGVSKAIKPDLRYYFLMKLNCRKAVTIEPIMDFDVGFLNRWIWDINPEIVWIGYNNYPDQIQLEEPSLEKTQKLINAIKFTTDVRLKTIREPKLRNQGNSHDR